MAAASQLGGYGPSDAERAKEQALSRLLESGATADGEDEGQQQQQQQEEQEQEEEEEEELCAHITLPENVKGGEKIRVDIPWMDTSLEWKVTSGLRGGDQVLLEVRHGKLVVVDDEEEELEPGPLQACSQIAAARTKGKRAAAVPPAPPALSIALLVVRASQLSRNSRDPLEDPGAEQEELCEEDRQDLEEL
eukprot:SAG22_NODE_1364_length_4611_cov_3.558732_4_plen_192_part_00